MISSDSKKSQEGKKVSFVIPIYHTEDYLKKCIESLLNQDYKNIEIIPVLDGKSRRARRILKQFNDNRIKEAIEIEHGGACKARNEGYKYALGDYVSFWDSDCYAELGMVRIWVKTFEQHPEVSFVYSGYRFNDNNLEPYPSKSFNEYELTCNNYIATMFPMKHEVFPGFDENLKSLQDWDLWLTLVEKGHKGWWNEGSGFVTEIRKGISSEGCSPENWLQRYEAVRNKHGIKGRNICFTSASHKYRPLELASIYEQDCLDDPSMHPHIYKMIYVIGCYAHNMNITTRVFMNAPKGCKRMIHWLGDDIESVYMLPYSVVLYLKTALRDTIDYHHCENEQSKQMLKDLGIDAKIMPLPMQVYETEKPKKFRVYYEMDGFYDDLAVAVIKACPDIEFSAPNMCNLADFACFLSLTRSIMPGENLKRFLAAGRKVVTNYQQLYANNTEPKLEPVIKALRRAKKEWEKGKINKEAQKYYADLIDINSFKRKVIDNVK